MENNESPTFVFHPQGVNIRSQYRFIGSTLRESTAGMVRVVQHIQSKKRKAVKVLPKPKVNNMQAFENEISLLSRLQHPNIVRLYEMYQDNRYIYLVMELYQGENLFDFLLNQSPLTEEVTINIIYQILLAVNYLHNRNIVHRDIRPNNFIFSTQELSSPLMLIDFTEARVRDNAFDGTLVGVAYYIAPEALEGNYSFKSDVWSIGVIAYMLLTGNPPFNGSDSIEIMHNIRDNNINYPDRLWMDISLEAKNFVQKLLTVNPEQRPSAQEALQHQWLQQRTKREIDSGNIRRHIRSINEYMKMPKFKQIALNALASRCTTSEIRELSELFKQIDKDCSGIITVDEFRQTLAQSRISDADIQQALEALDIDRTGTINYLEFISSTLDNKIYANEERLIEVFKMFDRNNSGTIDKDELRQALGDAPISEDPDYWDFIISEADANQDGVIDLQEFLDLMQRTSIER